ncbi:MAG TPA: hypothetical protein VEX37_07655 [Thermomicrobiales bacterium]|nr:hypothetical protein [Thermomicrobiales bacterium]
MSVLEWILSLTLFMVYFMCLVTVCRLTFQKGYTILGVVGIFVPLLWLVGAILPAKKGSTHWVSEELMHQQRVEQSTS